MNSPNIWVYFVKELREWTQWKAEEVKELLFNELQA